MTTPRSLKHEYELFVEREIESYKDTLPRSALLAIGDEAVARLRDAAQTTLTELVLWDEVDRIIARRVGLPTYQTWRRRHLKMLAEYRKPEHWGIGPASAVARELSAVADGGHVLVAGLDDASAVMYSAAHGCTVTALDDAPDVIERVLDAAEAAGFGSRMRGCVGDLSGWAPDVALRAVVCSSTALASLDAIALGDVVAQLQRATLDGGVHLMRDVQGPAFGPSLDALRARYGDWSVSVETDGTRGSTFLARKLIATH